ncbi:hypothetical protein KEM55_002222 [Ascosphaera atra]|nr:hypothetical protein KEM55_002222 [Ascosphaera atra]
MADFSSFRSRRRSACIPNDVELSTEEREQIAQRIGYQPVIAPFPKAMQNLKSRRQRQSGMDGMASDMSTVSEDYDICLSDTSSQITESDQEL